MLSQIHEIILDKSNAFEPKIHLKRIDGSILQTRKSTPNEAEDEFYKILRAWNKHKQENK